MIRKRLAAIACVVIAGHIASAAPPPETDRAGERRGPETDRAGERRGAGPDARRIVAVLDVHVDGVAPEVAAQFQSSLEAQVDTKHYWLAPRARVHELMANSTRWTDGCVVGSCLLEVKTQTGADVVLLAALTGSGTSFGFVVTLVRTDTGRVLAQEAQRCDVCTVNEVLAQSTLATIKLLNAVPDTLPDAAASEGAQLALAKQPLQRQVAGQRHHRRLLGTVFAMTGLVAVVTGIALYVTQDHASYGIATAAAGGGLALGGVVALTF